ncbi:hypothetical protein [Streptomyces fagopyri]|uniref:hypothetical protein n=1 Tax=Streptomyces fagopyri TaxID=2662397 RepID=UPI0033C16A62
MEGPINEFAREHGLRHCRYRGQPKTHLPHVFTAIAIIIERLSGRSATEGPLAETANRLPSLFGPERDPPVRVLADPRQLSPTIQDPRQSQVRLPGAAFSQLVANTWAGEDPATGCGEVSVHGGRSGSAPQYR